MKIAPLAVVAYVLPIYRLPGNVAVGVSTVLVTIPVCVVVGEGLAQVVKRVRHIQDELLTQEAEVRRLKEQEEMANALRESLDLLKRSQTRQRELAVQLLSAEEEERRRIAVGLHDDPAQLLTAALLGLQSVRDLPREEDTEEIQRVRDLLETTLDHIRHMMFELRPDSLDRHGLAAAVWDLIGYYGEASARYRLSSSLEVEPPSEVRIIAFRIIAEAVSNAQKHSHADSIQIVIDEESDGIGIDPQLTEDGLHGGTPRGIRTRPDRRWARADITGTQRGHQGRGVAPVRAGQLRVESPQHDWTTAQETAGSQECRHVDPHENDEA